MGSCRLLSAVVRSVGISLTAVSVPHRIKSKEIAWPVDMVEVVRFRA